jgi:hypothetical protein
VQSVACVYLKEKGMKSLNQGKVSIPVDRKPAQSSTQDKSRWLWVRKGTPIVPSVR